MAVKAIHRHLPTQAKLFQQGRIAMSALCPRCMQGEETNGHVFFCPQLDVVKQRKEDWKECWKNLHKMHTAVIIERTWRYHLQQLLQIPYETNMYDCIPDTHGDTSVLLQLAIEDQNDIGWDKLLLGMGSRVWKLLQEHIDCANPKAPRRSATDWFNSAIYQLLKFSIRCWKSRNESIYGSTRKEQRDIALEFARSRIKEIYSDPPTLDPRFRSIQEVPLESRLRLSLQGAEQWLSLVTHQIKVTQHNFKSLIRQHFSIPTHLLSMENTARYQAIERKRPDTPRKVHRRAIQLANKTMREKLYRISSNKQKPNSRPGRHTQRRQQSNPPTFSTPTSTRMSPPSRHHPP